MLHPGRMRRRRRVQNKDPVLLMGSRKKPGVCFRERVQPNLTNPSRTDVLPLPARTLTAFFFLRNRVGGLWETPSSEWHLCKAKPLQLKCLLSTGFSRAPGPPQLSVPDQPKL